MIDLNELFSIHLIIKKRQKKKKLELSLFITKTNLNSHEQDEMLTNFQISIKKGRGTLF